MTENELKTQLSRLQSALLRLESEPAPYREARQQATDRKLAAKSFVADIARLQKTLESLRVENLKARFLAEVPA